MVDNIYVCKICNYSTSRQDNYTRHISSKRHSKKVVETRNPKTKQILRTPQDTSGHLRAHVCEWCKMSYCRKSSLTRHLKICNKVGINPDDDIKLLKQELEFHKKELEMRNKELQLKDKDIQFYKDLVKKAGLGTSITNNQNMSVQSMIISKHADAPALEKACPAILHSQFDSDDEYKNAQVILYYYRRNMVASFIGDGIVAAYKKDNPDEQSLWSTDVSRLTMIIKKVMNKKSIWIADKKGVQTREYIIDPLMDKVKEIMKNYIETTNAKVKTAKELYNKMTADLDGVRLAIKLHDELDNKIYHDDILRYIAPRFSYDKINLDI